jgi:hypothetical protein
MSLNAKKVKGSGGKRAAPMEAGTYPAQVVQVLDLGLQNQRPYMSEEKPPAYEIMLTYEFADEFMQDEDGADIEDKPRWLSENFPFHNLNAERAKSTKRYMALDPDLDMEGDFSKLTGHACMVTITQSPPRKSDGAIFNNISGVSAMRAKEASKMPELKNPPKVFTLDDPDIKTFLSLPDWLQDKIKENLEFDGSELDTRLENYKGESEDKEADKKQTKSKPTSEEVDESSDNKENW